MSRLPFELMLALRYLRPKRTFVSVITLISVLGVTLGVAVLIIVISVMSGFDRQLRDRILGFNTHMKVLAWDRTMSDYPKVMSIVASNQNVKGVSPFVLGPVLLETQVEGEQSAVAGAFVRGVDPATEGSVSVLPSKITEGKFDFSRPHNGLVVGCELARILHLQVGDHVAIYSPKSFKKLKQERGKATLDEATVEDYEVRGIFDVGYMEYNANVVVTSLENAQDLYGIDDDVHGLLVMLKDPYKAAEVRTQLRSVLGSSFHITIWTEENSAILSALVVEKNMMFYLLFFIMIVAALCIMSALITFVVQKTREIGMLKALGATNGQIASLFVSQSAVVGVIGVIAGFGLGLLAIHYRNEFLDFMRRVTHWELFPAEVYGFDQLPAIIIPGDIAMIGGSALLICLLAGALPAWRASRLQPVEALRHE
jgi:lipoprotein-releasing system permease protein